MKTEISRDSHRPERDYSGVHQQQGRMLTDADWNELVAIFHRQITDALRDIVGSGTPSGHGASLVENHRLRAGAVYADGREAQLRAGDGTSEQFAYHAQRFPAPPLPNPLEPLRFYVDVWERTVTVLEDPELRDKALRGADTCTRTQRVAQVKWCNAQIEPGELPSCGNAKLTLSPPLTTEAQDNSLGTEPSPHLFRLEVHEVGGAEGNRRLTLKWSAENGAFAHYYDVESDIRPPTTFLDDRHVYEYFNDSDEQQLGHVCPGWGTEYPSRGKLMRWLDKWEPPNDKRFVRRWDGCCTVIELGDGKWTLDTDKDSVHYDGNTPLTDQGTTLVNIRFIAEENAVSLELELEQHTLTLELRDRRFLVGDYWLVAVRGGDLDDLNAYVSNHLPSGVEHAYLDLGSFDAEGNPSFANPEGTRRLDFPRLTDLHARELPYDREPKHGRWTQDGCAPTRVQDALDCLVQGKVSRSGDTMQGTLEVKTNLVVGDGSGSPKVVLDVEGGASIDGDLGVQGSMTLNRDLRVDGKLDVQGAATFARKATFDDGVQIAGDLMVEGTTTTVMSQDLVISDNIVIINRYEPSDTLNPARTAGLEVFRGPEKAAQLLWDEDQDRWLIGTKDALTPVGGAQNLVSGEVTFKAVGSASERISPEIDPGLGLGDIAVVLGLVNGVPKHYDIGKPEVVQWAEVNPANGKFRLHMKLPAKPAAPTDVRVRWWAFIPTRNATDVEVPPVLVRIMPAGTIELAAGAHLRLEATVSNSIDTRVQWSMNPSIPGVAPSGNMLEGNVPSLGSATAYEVRAVSLADDTSFDKVTVRVAKGKEKEKEKEKDKDDKDKVKDKVKDDDKVKDFPPDPLVGLGSSGLDGQSDGQSFIRPDERPTLGKWDR